MARKRKRTMPPLTADEVVVRAEKKLRQAEFFAEHLATMQRPGLPEAMEFYLSAAMTAARSAYYIVRDHGGPAFSRAQKAWRRAHQPADIAFHDRMKDRRDDDVHHGTVPAASARKWLPAHTLRGLQVFSSIGAPVEETNPDGTKVRAQALTSVPTLYIDDAGQRIEATTAVQQFIGLLRDLVGQFQSVSSNQASAGSPVGARPRMRP